jgi:Phage portal protein, lambda family
MAIFKASIVDKNGNAVTKPATVNLKYSAPELKQKSMGLFANIYGYGNAGKFRNRFLSLVDTNNGLDTYSRELLVRWCREITAQLPVVKTAITTITDFAVGDAYKPDYKGNNPEWWNATKDWALNQYYPHCCVRGANYPFSKVMSVISDTIMTDGDVLQIHGQDKYGYPLFQIIPNNRVHSNKDNYVIQEGQYKGCMVTDGCVYTMAGEAVGFVVQNSQNLVNSMNDGGSEVIFSNQDSNLIGYFDYIDKNRGLPRVGYAMLQALSLQELDSYLMDKIKIESLVGLIEATPTGEAPQELQDTLQSLVAQSGVVGNAIQLSPQDHALEIKQGPDIRYVKANGGDIKTLSSNTPGDQTANYMTRLEQQVCLSLGIPHQLIYSLQQAGGRITSAPAEIFRRTVKKQQEILDTVAKKTFGIALAKAMRLGLIPMNDSEVMTEVFDFTHPAEFSLDTKYDNEIIHDNFTNGFITFNDATTAICNKTGKEVIDAQAQEQIYFYTKAKEVADKTELDIQTVISNWKQTAVKVSVTKTIDNTSEDSNGKE